MKTATLNSVDISTCVAPGVDLERHTFRNVGQLGKELVEFLLALIELSATDIVDTKQGHDAVDDQETVFVIHEILGDLVEQLHLMLRIDSTSIGDVFKCFANH